MEPRQAPHAIACCSVGTPMSIVDFGRRLVQYLRLVRAMPGRVAQLSDLSARLTELGADLVARTTEANRSIGSEIAAQVGFTSHDFDQRIRELASTLEALKLDRRFSALDQLIVESIKHMDEINAYAISRLNVLDAQLSETKSLLARITEASRDIVSDISAQVGFTSYDFDQRISELANRLDVMDAHLSETRSLMTGVETGAESRFNALDAQLSETKPILAGVKASVESRFNLLDKQLSETKNLLTDVKANAESRLNALDTAIFETRNLITHVNTNTESRFNALDVRTSETKDLLTHTGTSIHTRLNTLEFETIDGLYDQLRELAANQFVLHAKAGSNRAAWTAHPAERYKRAKPARFDSYLARAKKDFPRVYPLWRERLDTMLNAFRETKTGNAAYVGDPDSRVFRSFVDMYAVGRVLDVGCGVFGRPYYLMDYPAKLISGLEPLPMIEAVDFELARGISEYLPWADESFSTVISATSLDHCMSLRRSLDEVVRVLRPKGRFLLWIDSLPKAPLYDPDRHDFAPADKFHLFHFDVPWFEPVLDRSFAIADRVELRRREFSRIMYCLAKR